MGSSAAFALIRREVQALDRSLPVFETKTVQAQLDETLLTDRLVALLSAGFGMLATMLASIGLYGVMAFVVARRRKELGIRIAQAASIRSWRSATNDSGPLRSLAPRRKFTRVSGGNAEAEEVGCLDNSRVVEGERTDPALLQRGSGAVEEGHIDPGRLIRRPPAQTGCTRVTLVQSARLRLRDVTGPSRDHRRAQMLAAKDHRVIKIDQLTSAGELQLRMRARATPTA